MQFWRDGELTSSHQSNAISYKSLYPHDMALQSLPASTRAPCSTSMTSSSSTFSTVIVHERFANVTPSIVHSLNTEIWCSDPISYSGVSEQPLGGNYPVLPAEATHSADQLGDLLNNNGIGVEKQPDCDSVREPNESDKTDEWLRCLGTGGLDDNITADMTSNYPQTAESAPVPSYLNSETWQHEHIIHQLVSDPTIPGQLYPTVSPPATINVHSPLRTRVRRRWTTEMHDRFVDAVNQLGGCENAKPKAIVDIMNVEGLTRGQVKSHLQKYKLAQVRHRPSEVAGISVDMATSNEGIPSDVQIHIQEFALQVQLEFQKKLREMVERTHQDLLEIHRSILEKHVMSLHELEERQNIIMDHHIMHLPPILAAAAAASPSALSAGGSLRVCGEGNRSAALVEDVHASEAGSLGNKTGA